VAIFESVTTTADGVDRLEPCEDWKPYRLAELGRLVAAIRAVNAHVELDPFWDPVVRGEDVSKEIALTPLSRW
jgi:hypothetical protein